MNHRVIALAIATLGSLLSQGALAQGLRPSGAPSGKGLTARPAAAPSITLPAETASGSSSSAPRQADFIVAVVNSEPVTNNEVRARLARAEAQLAQQGGAMPPRELLAREVLERIILERAQLQQAKESGLKVDDYAVSQAEQGVARQNNMSVDDLYRRLARDGMGKERFREELRNQLLLQRLRDATRTLHAEVERAGLMRLLLRGPLRRADYIGLLRNLHAIYDALELARTQPFARKLVNSGRLSVPAFLVQSALNTPDVNAFEGDMVPGAPMDDAPVRVAGQDAWLLDQLGNRFVQLVFVDDPGQLEPSLRALATALAAPPTLVDTTLQNLAKIPVDRVNPDIVLISVPHWP